MTERPGRAGDALAAEPGTVPDAAVSIPVGDVVRARVAADVAAPLEAALDRGLTGYAVLRPAEAMLFGADRRGVLTFADGVPVVAYEAAADVAGPEALAALAGVGPVRAELYRLPAAALAAAHDCDALRVAPDAPARDLAGDDDLAARTRDAAPDSRSGAGSHDALAAFLADEERVAAIQREARAEAEARAAEWGLTDELADSGDGGDSGSAGRANGDDSRRSDGGADG
ncbi:hypothetical protein [Halobaculum sp. D14]|uniref:hypothetical protein n=1 Tax=Halobaculum sp. D14 TaxID=3421642 RepID=UPI003EBAEDEC